MSEIEGKDTLEVKSYGKSKLRPIVKGFIILGVISATNAMFNVKNEFHLPEQKIKILNISEAEKLKFHLPEQEIKNLNISEPEKLKLHLPEQEVRSLILPNTNNVYKINKDNITTYSNRKVITEEDMNRKNIDFENLINKDFSPKG